jgi:ATP-dependent Clp protease ATP-binding subunit ClpA
MFERFTDRSRRVLIYAQDEARNFHHGFIGTEHILLGLIREEDGVAAKALSAEGVTYDVVHLKVKERAGLSDGPSPGAPPFTPRAKKVLELALREALQFGHTYIGTEHILLGLLREGEGVADHILRDLRIELSHVRERAVGLMSGQSAVSSTTPVPLSTQPVLLESAMLRGVVRTVGQQLRPDLDDDALDLRVAPIADELFDPLRKIWSEPDQSR